MYLLLSGVLNLFEIFTKLNISKLLKVVFIFSKIRNTFTQIGASINANAFPIYEAKRRTKVVKHRHYLDFKCSLAATSRAVRDV